MSMTISWPSHLPWYGNIIRNIDDKNLCNYSSWIRLIYMPFDFPQGTLLKPNMVTSGTKCESQADPQEVKKIKTLLKDWSQFDQDLTERWFYLTKELLKGKGWFDQDICAKAWLDWIECTLLNKKTRLLHWLFSPFHAMFLLQYLGFSSSQGVRWIFC